MGLGQAAGVAAAIAEGDVAKVDIDRLREILIDYGMKI
jgi:hypothetical protein